MTAKKCIILANGKPPARNVITYLRKKGYNTLICADGGANYAKKLKLVPDVIVGDLDSIEHSILREFKNTSVIIKITRQNDTDVEKCIKYALKNLFNDIILMGVTGDRLDHTFCNLGIVLKFYKQIKLKILAENSLLIPYSGEVTLRTVAGETISLYGFNKRTRISSKGLKYKLDNIPLPFGTRESTSNRAVKDLVKLKISGGVIFVIRDYHVMKSNDLL
jgi:thiamine pyrophosphokinase